MKGKGKEREENGMKGKEREGKGREGKERKSVWGYKRGSFH